MAKRRIPQPASSGIIEHLAIQPFVDLRTVPAKRAMAIRSAVIADCGGEQNLTAARLALIDRFAALTVQCELLDAAAADGDEIDLDLYGRLSAHLKRLGEAIGFERRARDVTSSLDDYLARKRQAEGVT